MNDTQKEIVFMACREFNAQMDSQPCFLQSLKWTACAACGRIAALATKQHNVLAITVQHAVEELESQIDGGEECRGRDADISTVIRILKGEADQ